MGRWWRRVVVAATATSLWWRRVVVAATATSLVLAGCTEATPPNSALVVLGDLRIGGEQWRLEGRRTDGRLCTALLAEGTTDPITGRCGLERTALRHLQPSLVALGGRIVLFSALPAAARRVRIDGGDGLLRVEAAQQVPGFPGRFFLTDLDPAVGPVTIRIFGEGGRAITP